MWYWLIVMVGIIFLFYCLLPNYWARNYSAEVFRTGSENTAHIALTFDDGPNPLYTGRLLDILKEFGISATFFVVGKQASRYPHLIRRMKSEGHTVGCHSLSHRHAWLMLPCRTYKDIQTAYEIVKKELGYPPRWYRPPWGMFNLLSMKAAKKLDLYPAYWSIEAQDWDAETTVEHIYNTVVSKAGPGSIIVLHDNGGAPGAPEKTLQALPSIIDTLQKKGYKFVTLGKLKGENSC
jgi:peptidoglycan/xylan/chitin deacetylase (PgdA/CDA1 family)